ncbi:MAG: Nre family DNA repair protein [Infirmifilum sp.]|uniref:Nre family DNA repair protein n=1 Tax=Infirmifilum TaxID=2856573 RepID=UPI0023555C9C
MSSRVTNMCLKCRGAKNLCGLPTCPFMSIWKSLGQIRPPTSSELEAPSPPSVFVGRVGYPKVRVAPSVATLEGDPSVYDSPERWLDYSLDEILKFRFGLVMGNLHFDVRRPDLVNEIALLSASSKPLDVMVRFAKPPRGLRLDPHAPPFGPSGVAEKIRVLDNPKIPRPVEKFLGDDGVRSEEAVWSLYESGLPVSTIQRVFSVGLLGKTPLRRLVPTRWSITAVDDMVSRRIIREVKGYPTIDSFLFFERKHSNNLFVGILAPYSWSFEWIEAWFPHTTWNPGTAVEVEADWEGFKGRTEYASLGGCYYASRLASAEYLRRERRQATVLLIREIYEGFFLPIGVWFVRENVRALFRGKPEKYDNLRDVIERLGKTTRLPVRVWLEKSRILRDLLKQARLEVSSS